MNEANIICARAVHINYPRSPCTWKIFIELIEFRSLSEGVYHIVIQTKVEVLWMYSKKGRCMFNSERIPEVLNIKYSTILWNVDRGLGRYKEHTQKFKDSTPKVRGLGYVGL